MAELPQARQVLVHACGALALGHRQHMPVSPSLLRLRRSLACGWPTLGAVPMVGEPARKWPQLRGVACREQHELRRAQGEVTWHRNSTAGLCCSTAAFSSSNLYAWPTGFSRFTTLAAEGSAGTRLSA